MKQQINSQSSISVIEDFAGELCKSWNNSSLPKKLGTKATGGSDWIDIETKIAKVDKGTQIIASGRYDCSKKPDFIIIIKKQADGTAKCVASGLYKNKRTWQFLPKTKQWKEYSKSFGMGAFWGLWRNGMKGNKTTAWSNSDNFKVFFQEAVKIESTYLSPGCKK
jgi:hypothetical protein